MTKADIARSIHQQAGVSEAEAANLLEQVIQLVTSTLQQGEPITIPGFGAFRVMNKGPRKGRNPHTGEPIMINARRVVSFRASSLWKAEVNAGKTNVQE